MVLHKGLILLFFEYCKVHTPKPTLIINRKGEGEIFTGVKRKSPWGSNVKKGKIILGENDRGVETRGE